MGRMSELHMDIVDMVADGFSPDDIAKAVGIPFAVAEKYVQVVMTEGQEVYEEMY